MRAAPALIAWHNDSQPIWSAHFEIGGKGRLATAGGDHNVRIWKVDSDGEERTVNFLATLSKHTSAVNVVRWCPHRELLASAGDDGNVLLWTPSDVPGTSAAMGEDHADDKEAWHVKRMCRSTTGAEIYDLAWSPDGSFFVTGSMDNVARIFDAQTGSIVRQIAEHNHYVQGVAWDPLNEFLATQSSDRSVHIYKLRTKDGQFSLDQHSRMNKMDLPPRRRTSSSPAPPDIAHHHRASMTSESSVMAGGASPAHSIPDTPSSLQILQSVNQQHSHSRRSSFGNAPSPAIRRSASPAPSMPLPAVMPTASPRMAPIASKNTSMYANEALTSFFRRLTFAPDGSLLFTPAGQYKTTHPPVGESGKPTDEITNTVYIYTRGGLNKPPVAHLPGHKKPSIAVRCSPLFYNLRLPVATKAVTLDASTAGVDPIHSLPEPAVPPKPPTSNAPMEPPSTLTVPSYGANPASPRGPSQDVESGPPLSGPPPAFSLPYRIVYAVATQDTIYVYDTQQSTPLCVISNLHLTTFTDVAWSNDGMTLLIASSDGFCSTISFAPNELGTPYTDTLHTRPHHPSTINTSTSAASTPAQTPTAFSAPGVHRHPSSAGIPPSPSPVHAMRPPSPTRSNSASSVGTQSSFARPQPHPEVINNPAPTLSSIPGLTASSAPFVSPTPPMTPAPASALGVGLDELPRRPSHERNPSGDSQIIPLKRGSESEKRGSESEELGSAADEEARRKKRRVRPVPVNPSEVADGAGRGQLDK